MNLISFVQWVKGYVKSAFMGADHVYCFFLLLLFHIMLPVLATVLHFVEIKQKPK